MNFGLLKNSLLPPPRYFFRVKRIFREEGLEKWRRSGYFDVVPETLMDLTDRRKWRNARESRV